MLALEAKLGAARAAAEKLDADMAVAQVGPSGPQQREQQQEPPPPWDTWATSPSNACTS